MFFRVYVGVVVVVSFFFESRILFFFCSFGISLIFDNCVFGVGKGGGFRVG